MQVKALFLFTVAASIFAAPAVMADEATRNGAADTDRATDFRGRPPFNRHAKSAASETQVAAAAPRADFRGRPPFSSHGDTEQVSAQFARFEETEAAADKPRRYGPPGKMSSRRR
ncbi:MAG: hypothetical protein QNJ00_11395 [Woeseiaceae bacterium]|nr:hypothetical protein [Woeseiaceae bacterium]